VRGLLFLIPSILCAYVHHRNPILCSILALPISVIRYDGPITPTFPLSIELFSLFPTIVSSSCAFEHSMHHLNWPKARFLLV
jgi:hypothetical protein